MVIDLEAQFEDLRRRGLEAEVADRVRRELALVRWRERLRGAVGRPVGLALLGGLSVSGILRSVGPDWLLLSVEAGQELVVPTAAVAMATGVPLAATPDEAVPPTQLRTTLGLLLRAIVRDRCMVVVYRIDGEQSPGTLDRVGADYIEVGGIRDVSAGRDGRVPRGGIVPLDALVAVRRCD